MLPSRYIDTATFSRRLRDKSVLLSEKKVLVANLYNSYQETDSYTKPNCRGFGRIRVFKNYTLHLRTAVNPLLKIKPLFRGHPPVEVLRTQVFQIAACNWRCWYCFVDDDRLSANISVAKFLSADELLDMYLAEDNPPDIIELSGGEPDLVPEWTLWMMEAMTRRGLAGKVYLWTENNLSTRFLWEFLSPAQIDFMLNFPMHSRVGCFKGCDVESFVFSTRSNPKQFEEQFAIFRDLLRIGFDMYAYATFIFSSYTDFASVMREFVDRLQHIHPKLPLRTIPLKINPFAAPIARHAGFNQALFNQSLDIQYEAYRAWEAELKERFTQEELEMPYDAVKLT